MHAALFLYGLVATVSPFGFAATLAVIASGRAKSLLFALAFVVGQIAACAVVVLVDVSILPQKRHDNTVLRGALELVFGVGLICLAVMVRRRATAEPAPPAGRSSDALTRLRRLRVSTAIIAGLVLGIGGPKRLLLTTLAGTTISASGVDDAEAIALVLAYSALATLLVWLPVLASAVAGNRVETKLDAAQRSLATHQREVGFYSLVVVGVIAAVHSLTLLT